MYLIAIAKLLPTALYGDATALETHGAMRSLATTIVNHVMGRATRHPSDDA